MAALSYTLRAAIPTPIERVFELLTTPALIPQWLPGCQSVEPPTALRRGSRIRVGFGTRAAEFEIVELTPPNNFGWIERRGRMSRRRDAKRFFEEVVNNLRRIVTS